jgi:hypothetical protein
MSQSREESKFAASVPQRKSGRAVFDDGRTVWEWQTATGVFERHVSDEQLARLEAADLQLADQPHPDTGRFIYGADRARQSSKQVHVARPAAAPGVARAERLGTFRQFLRRLVPST